MKLDRSFFLRPTLQVAEELLGKALIYQTPEGKIVGEINEVESYIGEDDLASHAAKGKTLRNALMFGIGGYTYIYLIYGMYFCLNIVTEQEGYPAAILIRSVIPKEGIELMVQNRGRSDFQLAKLTNGPGKVCLAYGLDFEHQGIDITTSERLYIENTEKLISKFNRTTRIGITKAQDKLWRFVYNRVS